MHNNNRRRPAAHVQAAIGAGQAKREQAARDGRSVAAHVQAAVGVGQAKMQQVARDGRPVAAHVRAAVSPNSPPRVLQRSQWSYENRPFGSKSGIMTGERMKIDKPPRSTVVANEGTGEYLSFQSNTKPTNVVKEIWPECDGHAEAYFLQTIRQKIAMSKITGVEKPAKVKTLALSSSPCSSTFGTTTKKGMYAQGCTELLISAKLTLGLDIDHLVCEKLYKCNSKKGAASSYKALSWLLSEGVVGKVTIKTAVRKEWLKENGVKLNKGIAIDLK